MTEIAGQEVTATLGMLHFFERKYPRWLKEDRFRYLMPGFWTKSNRVAFDPIGVIAVVGPSNFPFSLVAMQTCVTIMCGNAAIMKPSERCPETSALLRDIFLDSSLPAHVVEHMDGAAETTENLIAHPLVRKVLFTGSSRTGRRIAELCGLHFKPCVLELGGDGAAIICDDANPKLAARGLLWSTVYANGASCIGTRIVHVLPNVQAAFLDALRMENRMLRIGDPSRTDTDISSGFGLTIDLDGDNGATIIGRNDYENIKNATFDDVVRAPADEPVLRINYVDNVAQAIHCVNSSAYGLSASIWSSNYAEAWTIARSLDVGMVWINDASVAAPGFPWGGTRLSGWGRLFARQAIPTLTQMKTISRDLRLTARPKFWWFPYTQGKHDLTISANALMYGRRNRRAILNILSALWRFARPRKAK